MHKENPCTILSLQKGFRVFDAIAGDNNTYYNKPQEIITTKSRGGEDFVRQTDIDYNDDGTIDTKIMDPGKTKAVTTSNLYYTSGYKKGMLLKSTISAPNHDDRYINYEYDGKGRYLTKETDALGNWTEYDYDNRWGKVITKTGSDGVIVNNSHDGFGRLVSSTANTGESTLTTYTWDDLSTPDDSRYFVTTTNNDGGYAREYFDILGRSLRTETKKFDGTLVYTDTRYRSDGKTEWVSEPYISGTPNKSTYHYLNDGRIDYIEHPTATMDYTYSGATVTVTNTSVSPQQSSSKTYDALGNIKSATDHGGTITYNYHANGQPSSIVTAGHTVSMGYDQYGRQDTLNDPDAGLVVYDYTPFGELKYQRDARMADAGQSYTMQYDQAGRITQKDGPEGTTYWTYYESGNGKGEIKKIYLDGSPTNSIEYSYDEFGRVYKEIHKFDTKTFEYEFSYDAVNENRLKGMKYPSGFWIYYDYNSHGYLNKIKDVSGNTIWEGKTVNQWDQWTNYEYGNNLITKLEYDQYGYPQQIKTGTSTDDDKIQYNKYAFEPTTGNLDWRENRKHYDSGLPYKEDFVYDKLNRLTQIEQVIGTGTINKDINYDGTIGSTTMGNITSKTGVGTYAYEGSQPHAVTKVTDPGDEISSSPQNIQYTAFNKISVITQDNYELTITYDPLQNRRKSVLKEGSTVIKTKYFVGEYEEVEVSGNILKRHYITSPSGLIAVMEKNGSTETMNYIHTDYLGSIQYVSDYNGNMVNEYSYDAWGRLRNPGNWTYSATPELKFDRGYTFHEHLPEFTLINMNGRVYDPALGRMLSPDNFVQMPDFTQNFNRYVYCLNNPLIYTDPSGEFLIPALVGAWLLFTESGYEVQKYVSPVAVHVDVKLGTHQTGLGFDVSVGVPKAMPVSYRYNYGKTYYSKTYGDHSGWETRKGGEWTLFGTINYSGTTFSGVGYPREQTTNTITLGGPFVNLKYENDTYLGNFKLPGVPQGDPNSDAYRTAGARIKVGPFKMGMILHTGEGTGDNWVDTDGDGIPDTRAFTGGDVGDPSQSHGIFYVGFGPFRIGRDTENIRQTFQNDFAHDGFNGGNRGSAYPWILTLDRDPRWFFQFGWGNGSTLY